MNVKNLQSTGKRQNASMYILNSDQYFSTKRKMQKVNSLWSNLLMTDQQCQTIVICILILEANLFYHFQC